MRRIITLSLLFALFLGLTQCKKESAAPIDGKTLAITLNASCGSERSTFLPGPGTFVWTGSAATEYINVSGSESGYLGQLSCNNDEGSFSGSITEPEVGEDIYFFYLGNGDHAAATELSLSNQSADAANITNHLIAISNAVPYSGQTSFNVTLEIKIAIARFNVSGFTSPANLAEGVSISGEDVYKNVTIDYKQGKVTGNEKGKILIGNASTDKFVVMIPSVSSATTINFESESRIGSLRFGTGIQAGKYYGTVEAGHVMPMTVTPANKIFFSTSAATKVAFSKGNLQYTRTSTDADWSTGTWSFMTNQYDIVENNGAVSTDYASQTAIGLFGWGQSGATDSQHGELKPNRTDIENYCSEYEDLTNTVFDWGVRNSADITNGEGYSWRTPSKAEFEWLLGVNVGEPVPGTNCRNVTNRWLLATINAGGTNHNGLIIFPDIFSFDLTGYTCNDMTDWAAVDAADWTAMEDAGAIFLPTAGYRFRDGIYISEVGSNGYYWTSRWGTSGKAWEIDIQYNSVGINMPFSSNGFSVRLVRDLQ